MLLSPMCTLNYIGLIVKSFSGCRTDKLLNSKEKNVKNVQKTFLNVKMRFFSKMKNVLNDRNNYGTY